MLNSALGVFVFSLNSGLMRSISSDIIIILPTFLIQKLPSDLVRRQPCYDLLCERLVRNENELVESVHIGDREVGENLAVHIDACELEAMDQVGIVGSADPCARIDTSDPKAAVFPLLELTADIGVSH